MWVLGRHKPVLIKVSAPTRQRIVTLRMGRHAERVDVAAGFVWVTDYGEDAVTRVDPKGPKIVTTDVPGRPYGLSAREDGVWVACYGDQSVVRIDPTRAASWASRSGSASTPSPSTSAAIRRGSRASPTTA